MMNSKDAISGTLGTCYIETSDKRYEFAQIISLEATFEKLKAEVPILGKTGRGNKATGWKGTGSATFPYNTSIFRAMAEKFKNTGEDVYFTIQVINNDPTSSVGFQTVILKNVNFDSLILAKLDVEADYLDEDMDFTFDDFEIPTKFIDIAGM